MLKTLSSALLDFVFPPHCHVCRSFIPRSGRLNICSSCLENLQPLESPLCTICSMPFHGKSDDHPCGSCIKNPPAFDAARAAYIYEGAVRELVHRFKYDYRTHLRRPLAIMTAEALSGFIRENRPDLIVPVPLHVRRLRSRGFNQAVLLGELLSKEWGIPMDRRTMSRIRWTEPQITLDVDQRKENVKGAFSVSDPAVVRGRSVLLLDDVYTTGSTAGECARVLKRNGAERVLVATVARAIL